jgi:peroxiredoxin Q/BCP
VLCIKLHTIIRRNKKNIENEEIVRLSEAANVAFLSKDGKMEVPQYVIETLKLKPGDRLTFEHTLEKEFLVTPNNIKYVNIDLQKDLYQEIQEYIKDKYPGMTVTDFVKYIITRNAEESIKQTDPEMKNTEIPLEWYTRVEEYIKEKNLNMTLISDPDKNIQKKYSVWKLKKFMGREFMGTIRTTFLIDKQGKIAYIWNNVKVKGHVEQVLDQVKKMMSK